MNIHGVVERAETDADVGQQPHAFDMVRNFLEELPAEVLGFQQFSLPDQVDDGDERLRQRRQEIELCFYLCRLLPAALKQQYLELAPPGRDERRIEAARAGIGLERILRPVHGAVRVAFFLVSAPVFRRQFLQG